MPAERRGQVIAVEIGSTGNGRNPTINGGRQPSCGDTSRMNREVHVRICERLGVKLPGATRPAHPTAEWQSAHRSLWLGANPSLRNQGPRSRLRRDLRPPCSVDRQVFATCDGVSTALPQSLENFSFFV